MTQGRVGKLQPVVRGLVLAGLVAASVALVAAEGTRDVGWTEPWSDGAQEYGRVFDGSDGERPPVFVYFYTDWCGYCRQFEAELLSADNVISFLEDLEAVRVNPEKGAAEAELARRYGVRSFPALFLHADGRPEEFVAVRRTVMDGGRLRLKNPDEFIATISQGGG